MASNQLVARMLRNPCIFSSCTSSPMACYFPRKSLRTGCAREPIFFKGESFAELPWPLEQAFCLRWPPFDAFGNLFHIAIACNSASKEQPRNQCTHRWGKVCPWIGLKEVKVVATWQKSTAIVALNTVHICANSEFGYMNGEAKGFAKSQSAPNFFFAGIAASPGRAERLSAHLWPEKKGGRCLSPSEWAMEPEWIEMIFAVQECFKGPLQFLSLDHFSRCLFLCMHRPSAESQG